MTKQTTHRKETPIKKRDGGVYQKKVAKITNWYNKLVENQKKSDIINKHNNQPYKRADLKPLEYYIERIKKVVA